MTSDTRPPFARDFPRAKAVDDLVDAFARGDYGRVRSEGRKLVSSAQDQAVRDAARILISRTSPDPLAVWLLVLAGGLLVALSGYWIAQGHPPSARELHAPQTQ